MAFRRFFRFLSARALTTIGLGSLLAAVAGSSAALASPYADASGDGAPSVELNLDVLDRVQAPAALPSGGMKWQTGPSGADERKVPLKQPVVKGSSAKATKAEKKAAKKKAAKPAKAAPQAKAPKPTEPKPAKVEKKPAKVEAPKIETPIVPPAPPAPVVTPPAMPDVPMPAAPALPETPAVPALPAAAAPIAPPAPTGGELIPLPPPPAAEAPAAAPGLSVPPLPPVEPAPAAPAAPAVPAMPTADIPPPPPSSAASDIAVSKMPPAPSPESEFAAAIGTPPAAIEAPKDAPKAGNTPDLPPLPGMPAASGNGNNDLPGLPPLPGDNAAAPAPAAPALPEGLPDPALLGGDVKPADAIPSPQAVMDKMAPSTSDTAAAAAPTGKPKLSITFLSSETAVPLAVKPELDKIVKEIKNKSERVSLIAYASGNNDQATTARRVSLSRALAVRAYLIDQGISNLRINVQAEGNKNPGGEAERVDVFINPAK